MNTIVVRRSGMEKGIKDKLTLVIWYLLLGGAFFLLVFLCLPPGKPVQPLTTQVVSDDQTLISLLFEENREPVSLSEVPLFVQQAFLSVEDHRFYKHSGISPVSLLRAAYNNFFTDQGIQGGSTITQQLVKNGFLTPERSILRKIKEMFLAWKLELHYSKEAILEMYLNQIYFGHGAHGIKTAAQTYFGRPLNQLNRIEMALLAGIPKGPAFYSPYLHPDAARERIRVVLKRMEKVGYLSEAEARQIMEEPLRLSGRSQKQRKAPYFLDFVLEEAAEKLQIPKAEISTMGLRIETTLSLPVQQAAEEVLATGLHPYQKGIQPQGALIAADSRTGEVKALVGGTNYSKAPFNRALHAHRQPGSAFKPFVYLAALDAGYTLASTVPCRPLSINTPSGRYEPTDYGSNKYHHKDLTLRQALAESCNIAAVTLHYKLDILPTIQIARRLGITSPLSATPALALGTAEVTPLELLAAYLPLANGGWAVKPWAIKRIYDPSGKLLWQRREKPRSVLDPRLAFLITSALKDTLQPGGTAATAGRELKFTAAGKTGTTQENRDAWFICYTPTLTAVVYIGDDHNHPLPAGGGALAAPIGVNFLNRALAGQIDRDFPLPGGVITRRICRETGLLATPNCLATEEYFRFGHEPTTYCMTHRRLKLRVCAKSGLLPGENCQNTVVREYLWREYPTAHCTICPPSRNLWQLLFGDAFSGIE